MSPPGIFPSLSLDMCCTPESERATLEPGLLPLPCQPDCCSSGKDAWEHLMCTDHAVQKWLNKAAAFVQSVGVIHPGVQDQGNLVECLSLTVPQSGNTFLWDPSCGDPFPGGHPLVGIPPPWALSPGKTPFPTLPQRHPVKLCQP